MARTSIAADEPRLTYRPELDAIRGAAIALVVIQHFILGSANQRAGQVGVTLFFVLSGYLITSVLLAEYRATGRVSLSAFYVRRARRLVPALVAVVAVVTLLGWPANGAAALTYTTNIVLSLWPATPHDALGHTWSLGIEEQFYLVWPVLFLALARWPRAMMAVAIAIAMGSALARPYTGLLQRNDALLAGAALAMLAPRIPAWVGLMGWVIVLVDSAIPGQVDQATYNLAVLGAVAAIAAPGKIAWSPLVRLGKISYGLYLIHFPVAFMLRPMIVVASAYLAWAMIGLGITVSVILALASERWIEAPFRAGHARPTEPPIAMPTSAATAWSQPS